MEDARPVAVVIPSWNSASLLSRCFESLQAQDVELELLVVDNGSNDGSVFHFEGKGIPHLAMPHNVGFAAAVNLGVQQTAAPAVLVLNADTVLEPGCIRALLAALEADPSLAGVQPRILQLEDGGEPERPRIYSVGQALTRDGRAYEQGAGQEQGADHLLAREIFGICGAACLFRREAFTALGGYDERYFAFYEDVDLNVRARISGWRFSYVPEAVVWHVGNASWSVGFRRPAADNARLVARNRLATQIKFMPGRQVPRIAAGEVGALSRSVAQRRFLATLRGKLGVLPWLGDLIAERRRLRESGDPSAARRWLGREGP